MKFSSFVTASSLASILLLSSACSIPDWIGGSAKQKKLEGERITLLQQSTTIESDQAVANEVVQLPHPRRNTRWYKSTGQHILTEQNPRSPWDFKSHIVIDAGEGSDDTHYPLAIQPVIADETIFVMDAAGMVSAYPVGETSQTPLWQTHIEVPEDKENFALGGLAYDQGKLFVNSGYSATIALNAKTGQAYWQKSLASVTRSAPDARDGMLFVKTLDNKLYALSQNDGTILWIHAGIEKELTQVGSASPVALGEAVLSSYSSGELFALKASDGKRVWTDVLAQSDNNNFYLLSDIDVTPVVSNGRVYASSLGGSISSFELFSGTRVWERSFSSSGNLWIASNFLYALSDESELAAFYVVNGGVKWVSALPKYEDQEEKDGLIHWSGPVMAGSRLLVVGSHGRLIAISPLSGKAMQEYDVAENIYSAPVAAYGNIYLYTNDAELHIYSGPAKVATLDDFVSTASSEIVDKAEDSGTTVKRSDDGASAIGDFFTGILKRFKAEKEDDAEPDERP